LRRLILRARRCAKRKNGYQRGTAKPARPNNRHATPPNTPQGKFDNLLAVVLSQHFVNRTKCRFDLARHHQRNGRNQRKLPRIGTDRLSGGGRSARLESE
jgi:hypothetical protein